MKNKFKYFFLFFIFILITLIVINSCSINPLYLKSPQMLEKFSEKHPLLPYFYIKTLKFEGIVVVDKEVKGIKLPPLNITFEYVKNDKLKVNLNLNVLFKNVSFAEIYYDFVKTEGYIKSSYSLYYKEIDENFLKSLSPYLNSSLVKMGLNTLFLLFERNQSNLLDNKEIIVSQFFKYFKESGYIKKISFEIPQIQLEIDYKNLKMVDSILKYPYFIEGTYYKNRISTLNFKIAIKEIETEYNF